MNPKPVTVTANDASKTYGQADPTLTATVTGLVGSDTVNYTISREAGEDAGTYTITPTGEAAQGNYTVRFAPGTFTIEASAKVITSPRTGDESNLALWSSLMILSLAAMIVLLPYTRKRKTEK